MPLYLQEPCMGVEAESLYLLILSDPRQKRGELHCNPHLVRAAEAKARDMGQRGYFDHCDPDGVCSNTLAEKWGCDLPEFYTPNGNNIESLGAGSPNVGVILAALARSKLHAIHIFGLHEFFRTQHDIGVGVAQVDGSPFGWYYVVLIAECINYE